MLKLSSDLKENTTRLLYNDPFREIVAVYSEIHKKIINTLCGQTSELLDAKHVKHT
jgi:hypothetical protein